jgi:deferrochelatase/peroxidase EfeB
MVGRWRSGAPLELTPLQDDSSLAADQNLNNDFSYEDDPFQRACPYAAHIRKTNPRDDFPNGNKAQVQIRRIARAGIPFGPEVGRTETVTSQPRGLMFVCYQTSIRSQFEFIQSSWANTTNFIFGKVRRELVGIPRLQPLIRSSGRRQGAARVQWTSQSLTTR